MHSDKTLLQSREKIFEFITFAVIFNLNYHVIVCSFRIIFFAEMQRFNCNKIMRGYSNKKLDFHKAEVVT